jgi:hypothetical protein
VIEVPAALTAALLELSPAALAALDRHRAAESDRAGVDVGDSGESIHPLGLYDGRAQIWI